MVHVAIVHKKLQEVLPLSDGGLGGRVQGREAYVGSAGQDEELGELVQGGEAGGNSQGDGEPGQGEKEGSTYENDGQKDLIDQAGQGDFIDQDRQEGFIRQNGQEDKEKEEDNEETKRGEPRIGKLNSQKGSEDLNQKRVVVGFNVEADILCDKEEMGKDEVSNQVKKVKTEKSTRRSKRQQVNLMKITKSKENRRYDCRGDFT